MNAVTKLEPRSAEVISDPMMAGLIKAASDPNTDADKLERLMGLYERHAMQNANRAYIAALAEMQAELPTIGKRGTVDLGRGGKGYTFAKWEDINEAIKPVLHKHGFKLNFKIGSSEKTVTVTGMLSHNAGYTDETTMTLPYDTSGSKNPVQAMGSSISYGKRYIANALLNLVSRDGVEADDDGRQAVEHIPDNGVERITPAEHQHLLHLIAEAHADEARFCNYMRVPSLPELPASQFNRAVTALAKKKQAERAQ